MSEQSQNTLPEFQTYLRERKLASEEHIPFLAAVLRAGYRRLLRSPQQKALLPLRNISPKSPEIRGTT
jgi:hypothetical protein